MRVEYDEFLWTINWCCNGCSGEENSGKKGVEEHDDQRMVEIVYEIIKGRRVEKRKLLRRAIEEREREKIVR